MEGYITKDRAMDLIIAASQGHPSRRANLLSKLEDEPAADVVEVTRCKNCVKNEKCMLYSDYRYPFFDEDFCSYGWDGEEE